MRHNRAFSSENNKNCIWTDLYQLIFFSFLLFHLSFSLPFLSTFPLGLPKATQLPPLESSSLFVFFPLSCLNLLCTNCRQAFFPFLPKDEEEKEKKEERPNFQSREKRDETLERKGGEHFLLRRRVPSSSYYCPPLFCESLPLHSLLPSMPFHSTIACSKDQLG